MSPYLRSHAENPVDWWPWGADAFAEAARRDVPVFVSIGYSTCHWCHVMARESFSDPIVASYLNANFVAIKVDREEHPDVDASYMAAASAFTRTLGWPLNVFTTAEGRAFYAGSYFPPRPVNGLPEFLRVLGAVTDAWTQRRAEVEDTAAAVAEALTESAARASAGLVSQHEIGSSELAAAVEKLAALEDPRFGGFGVPPDFDGPKFAVAPAVNFLLEMPGAGAALAARTLKIMGASPLRDPVEGGFFRYSTQRDWGEPHYERMLYDNALLLDAAVRAWQNDAQTNAWAAKLSTALAGFLLDVLRLPSGAFASAQDSESVLGGHRSEGGYYALDEDARAMVDAPPLDEKVLSCWNGLAIAALARAGAALQRSEWIDAARTAADHVLALHLVRREPGSSDAEPPVTLARASLGERLSAAPATLEDYGMLAQGLLALAVASGEAHYAVVARELVDACLAEASATMPCAVPGGADPVLAAHGLALELDASEGAYPSGISATGEASFELYLLTGDDRYRLAAERAVAVVGAAAAERPLAYGALLALAARLQRPIVQLVSVVTGAAGGSHAPEVEALLAVARQSAASVSIGMVVTEAQARALADAGFELLAGRTAHGGRATSYLCESFVCHLGVTDASALAAALRRTAERG